MKVFISLLFIAISAHAGTISFIGPCEKNPLFSIEYQHQKNQSIGHLTIETLKKHNISFNGTEQQISSIFNTPVSSDAIEIISDTEMLAYGWCYSINGLEPNVYPDQIILEENDVVLWWFGYAHYKNEQWITQCAPSFQRRSNQFCD